MSGQPAWWNLHGRPILGMFLLGCVGVIAILPGTAVQLKALPNLPEMPLPVVILLSLLQPMVLLGVLVALGVLLAPRTGLRSLLHDRLTAGDLIWPILRTQMAPALFAAVAAAVSIILLDLAFAPLMPAPFSQPLAARGVVVTISGMLYGGLTEELMMRWGMMTLLVWMGWRLFQRGTGKPNRIVLAAAVLISAILFGAGHLGAVAMVAPLTPVLILRTIVLNAIGGVLYGWLYARHSLEAAMVAHAATHVVMTVITLLVP